MGGLLSCDDSIVHFSVALFFELGLAVDTLFGVLNCNAFSIDYFRTPTRCLGYWSVLYQVGAASDSNEPDRQSTGRGD